MMKIISETRRVH